MYFPPALTLCTPNTAGGELRDSDYWSRRQATGVVYVIVRTIEFAVVSVLWCEGSEAGTVAAGAVGKSALTIWGFVFFVILAIWFHSWTKVLICSTVIHHCGFFHCVLGINGIWFPLLYWLNSYLYSLKANEKFSLFFGFVLINFELDRRFRFSETVLILFYLFFNLQELLASWRSEPHMLVLFPVLDGCVGVGVVGVGGVCCFRFSWDRMMNFGMFLLYCITSW